MRWIVETSQGDLRYILGTKEDLYALSWQNYCGCKLSVHRGHMYSHGNENGWTFATLPLNWELA